MRKFGANRLAEADCFDEGGRRWLSVDEITCCFTYVIRTIRAREGCNVNFVRWYRH